MHILPVCAEQALSLPHQRPASLLIAVCVHVSERVDVYVRAHLFVCLRVFEMCRARARVHLCVRRSDACLSVRSVSLSVGGGQSSDLW